MVLSYYQLSYTFQKHHLTHQFHRQNRRESYPILTAPLVPILSIAVQPQACPVFISMQQPPRAHRHLGRPLSEGC